MPVLSTPTQRLQQQRLERVWRQQAVQMPVRRQRLPWLPLLGAGVVIGLLLGHLHSWLIKPINPVIEQRPCLFELPELTPEQLEPVIPPELARRWAPGGDLHHHLGPQLPKAPAPAPPAEPAQGDHC